MTDTTIPIGDIQAAQGMGSASPAGPGPNQADVIKGLVKDRLKYSIDQEMRRLSTKAQPMPTGNEFDLGPERATAGLEPGVQSMLGVIQPGDHHRVMGTTPEIPAGLRAVHTTLAGFDRSVAGAMNDFHRLAIRFNSALASGADAVAGAFGAQTNTYEAVTGSTVEADLQKNPVQRTIPDPKPTKEPELFQEIANVVGESMGFMTMLLATGGAAGAGLKAAGVTSRLAQASTLPGVAFAQSYGQTGDLEAASKQAAATSIFAGLGMIADKGAVFLAGKGVPPKLAQAMNEWITGLGITGIQHREEVMTGVESFIELGRIKEQLATMEGGEERAKLIEEAEKHKANFDRALVVVAGDAIAGSVIGTMRSMPETRAAYEKHKLRKLPPEAQEPLIGTGFLVHEKGGALVVQKPGFTEIAVPDTSLARADNADRTPEIATTDLAKRTGEIKRAPWDVRVRRTNEIEGFKDVEIRVLRSAKAAIAANNRALMLAKDGAKPTSQQGVWSVSTEDGAKQNGRVAIGEDGELRFQSEERGSRWRKAKPSEVFETEGAPGDGVGGHTWPRVQQWDQVIRPQLQDPADVAMWDSVLDWAANGRGDLDPQLRDELGAVFMDDAMLQSAAKSPRAWSEAIARMMHQGTAETVAKSAATIETRDAKIEKTVSSDRVTTDAGRKIDVAYKAVELDDLIASHDDNSQPNPKYPQQLQPRDRSRTAGQIDEILGKLDPERLGRNPLASDGAPIVGDDMVVESGNGRVIVLRKAYRGGGERTRAKSAQYRAWLRDNAESFGMDPRAIDSMREPVLVRVRKTKLSDEDRVAFTREANEATTAKMSPTEQAKVDASSLDDDLMRIFAPGENGELDIGSNREFLSDFLSRLPQADRDSLRTSQGTVSKALVDRVRNAVVLRGYNDHRLVERLAEDLSPDLKNMLNAFVSNAGKAAELRWMQESGSRRKDGYAVIDSMVEAFKFIDTAKRDGQDVGLELRQSRMFGGIDPQTKAIAKAMHEWGRSPKKLREFFRALLDQVDETGDPRQSLMFGGKPPKLSEIIQAAYETVTARNAEAGKGRGRDLFGDDPETGRGQARGANEGSTRKPRADELGDILTPEPGRVDPEAGFVRVSAKDAKNVEMPKPSKAEGFMTTLKRYAVGSARFFEKLGSEAGKAGAKGLREISRRSHGEAATDIQALHKIFKGQKTRDLEIAMLHANKRVDEASVPENVRALTEKIRAVMDRAMSVAKGIGMKRRMQDGTFVPIEGSGKFAPQTLNSKGEGVMHDIARARKTQRVLDAAQKMVDSGQATTLEEGLGLLGKWKKEHDRAQNRYLESSRIELPIDLIEWNPKKTLEPVLHSAWRTIEATREWGYGIKDGQPFMPIAQSIAKQLELEHGPAHSRIWKDYIDSQYGFDRKFTPEEHKAANFVSSYQTLRTLGGSMVSVIRNGMQPAVNAAHYPWRYLLESMKELPPQALFWMKKTNEVRERMERAGAVGGVTSITDVEPGILNAATRVMMKPFSSIESSNQARSAVVAWKGMEKDLDVLIKSQPDGALAKKLSRIPTILRRVVGSDVATIRRRIAKLGVSDAQIDAAIERGKWTTEEMEAAAYRMVADTQFRMDAATKRLWYDQNPWLRTLFKFKQFAFDQYLYAADYVATELRHGNVAPAVRFFVASSIAGEIYNVALDLLRSKDESITMKMLDGEGITARELGERMLNNFIDGGAIGWIMDLQHGIGEFLGGPAVGSLSNALEAGAAITRDPNVAFDAIQKFATGEVRILRDAQSMTRRAEQIFGDDDSFQRFQKWRDRAFQFKDQEEFPGVGGMIQRYFDGAFQGRVKRHLKDTTFALKEAGDELRTGDISGAASMFVTIFNRAETREELGSALRGIKQSMRSQGPGGGIAQKDLGQWLSRYSEGERKEFIQTQKDWNTRVIEAIKVAVQRTKAHNAR